MTNQPSTAQPNIPLLDNNTRIFLQQKVHTLVRWDLIRFFHDNPHTKDTAENIAEFMGRDPSVITRELDGLVDSGVLQVKEKFDLRIYDLTSDELLRTSINNFMEVCHDRDFRAEAIHYVIQEMQISHFNDS